MHRQVHDHKHDAAGAGISFACMAHCLATPIAATVIPALAPLAVHHDELHLLTLLAALPLVTYGLWLGQKRHGMIGSLIPLAVAGVALLALGAAHDLTGKWETEFTLLGASLLAATHILNWHRSTRVGVQD